MALIPALSRFVKNHSTTILAALGVAGTIGTAILVAKETPEAIKRVEAAMDEKGERLTIKETAIVGAPAYIPAIVTCVGTCSCIIGMGTISSKKVSAVQGAYILLQNSYKEYKDKVKELNPEFHQQVEEEIAKSHYNIDDIHLESDKILFYDEYSKRYFESTMMEVREAEYNFNRNFTRRGYACVEEFYDLLAVDGIDWKGKYEDVGWNIWMHEGDPANSIFDVNDYSWVEFEHHLMTLDDGLECYMIVFPIQPRMDFMDY